MWEAPVKVQRTSVGLDVHARSVVACGLDGDTGELFERRLTPDHGEIVAWLGDLPGPVAATYEAGPTGFVLARSINAAGIRCSVAAPSKLQRPVGDRVKTDIRDARHLARLLHLGEIVEVEIPSVEQESARDLFRAREACRRDLMAARNRLSKLLLRRGIVYYRGAAWSRNHERWLRAQRFDDPALAIAYDTAFDTVLATTARRDRLDSAIIAMAADSSFTAVVTRLGCLRGVSTLTAFGLATRDRRLAPADRPLDRRLPRAGAMRVLLGSQSGPGRADPHRQHPRPPAVDRGGLASPAVVSARRGDAAALGCRLTGGASPRPGRQPTTARPLAAFQRTQEASRRGQRGHRPRVGRLVLVIGRHGRLRPPNRPGARIEVSASVLE
jgi:transposase